jgi:hypothetical protein
MMLATFEVPGGSRVGIVDGEEVVDLTAADPSLATMIDLLDRCPVCQNVVPEPARGGGWLTDGVVAFRGPKSAMAAVAL